MTITALSDVAIRTAISDVLTGTTAGVRAIATSTLAADGVVGATDALASQRALHNADQLGRPVRHVGQRAVFDLAVLAVGLAEQDGLEGLALDGTPDSGHVHGHALPLRHTPLCGIQGSLSISILATRHGPV